MSEKVTFSFGENWCDYLGTLTDEAIDSAANEIDQYLKAETLKGKSFIDIGSGSGIHSLAAHRFGVRNLCSLDVDPRSVEATTKMWEKAGRPDNWTVKSGSILDDDFVRELGSYDIVYSWGVLHHTGSMWEAINNAISLVAPGGQMWIAIYVDGPNYQRDLDLKKKYNAATDSGKRWMLRKWIFRDMLRMAKNFENPFIYFQNNCKRGMNRYNDAIDWLGGLPYEVASAQEILEFCKSRGLILEGIEVAPEGGCSDYVLRHVPELNRSTEEQTPSRVTSSA